MLALRLRDVAAAPLPLPVGLVGWRILFAGPVVAVVTMLAALLVTDAAGLPLRDPDHVAGRRLLLVFALVVVLVGLDVVGRAARRSNARWPSREALASVRRERWTRTRCVAVGSALTSFYVTYLAYRNLKSVVPLLRPDDLFDRQLGAFDRGLFGGRDPATLMHSAFGTGIATHVFSGAYMVFFAFIPATLALALVFSPYLQAGLFYATAQSLNWLLGAASYFLLPSLGPIYVDHAGFSALPTTGASRLQDLLLDQRVNFLGDPHGGTAQSIAAFSSLHVSIFFTAALATHLLGMRWRLRVAAWSLLGLTTGATIFLGWHYVADDIGGLVLGALALLLARALTGFDLRGLRRSQAEDHGQPRRRRAPRRRPAWWRATAAGPAVAAVTVAAGVLETDAVGLPLRDPDHVAALYLALVGFGVAGMIGLDILIRSGARPGRGLPSRATLQRTRRERWTLRRTAVVGSALVAFYLTYMAYRNLKSVVPLLRPGDLFDRQLAGLDRELFAGNDPAELLQAVLGTGVSSQVLSGAYVAFIVFLPLTIGVALVFARDLRVGLLYTSAQSINWVLGAASYLLVPSLGPVYSSPATFARLPHSEVTHLQNVLLDQRLDFLRNPASSTPQSIAAFASLHVSMSFTAALAAQVLGARRRLRIALWSWFVVTCTGTIYLGWH